MIHNGSCETPNCTKARKELEGVLLGALSTAY
jgi:hypothetical protein